MPSATTTSTTTSSRMRLSKPATNPMHPTPPPLPVPASTAMAIFTKALTWNPPPLIPASAPSRSLSSPSSPRAAATTTTLWMPFWWRRKTPLLNRSRRRGLGAWRWTLDCDGNVKARWWWFNCKCGGDGSATVNSNYGQLAHSGSMGFGVVVAARCREHGEAVAAGNGGMWTAMVGARGSFTEAANLIFFFKIILNLWLRSLCNRGRKEIYGFG